MWVSHVGAWAGSFDFRFILYPQYNPYITLASFISFSMFYPCDSPLLGTIVSPNEILLKP